MLHILSSRVCQLVSEKERDHTRGSLAELQLWNVDKTKILGINILTVPFFGFFFRDLLL